MIDKGPTDRSARPAMPAADPRPRRSRLARFAAQPARATRGAPALPRCPIGEHATQAVPGEGLKHARLMFVGEQPGDQEDLQGRPFVGPAGSCCRALREIGVP